MASVSMPSSSRPLANGQAAKEQISLLVGQILSPGANLVGALLGPGGKLASQIKQKGEEE